MMLAVTSARLRDLKRFYVLVEQIESICRGCRLLRDCSGRQNWPQRGVYFFHEDGEHRTDTGTGLRIVRVGTHALKNGSRTTLWNRLSQHKGVTRTGGGNHRGSIFRLIVGQALIQKHGYKYEAWGDGGAASVAIRKGEEQLEQEVSLFIGRMPFLWFAIDDIPNPDSLRGFIERNAIALLSNFGKSVFDTPSNNWLGRYSNRAKIRDSGLWNQNHVEETCDPTFLDVFERLISQTRRVS
ncbi:MAG: hypothetical protein ACLQJ7_14100 [Syntrophobacteraceae bacterium]